MSLTRANVESILVSRCGPLMTAADMAITVVGSNEDLNDPIGYGIRQAEGAVGDPSSVTDTDVASVSSANLDIFLDWCEYRLLKNILGNLDDVDITAGPRSEKLSQLAEQAKWRVEEMETSLKRVVADTFSLNFVEHR